MADPQGDRLCEDLACMTCLGRHACVRGALGACGRCRSQHHGSNLCHPFPERFRRRVERVVRGFARAQRRGQPISARIERRRKSAVADLKQWRRSHGYTPATAGRAQPAVNRATVLADQLGERLAEAEGQISDLQDEAEEGRAERMVLAGRVEELEEEREELMGLLMERDAQLADLIQGMMTQGSETSGVPSAASADEVDPDETSSSGTSSSSSSSSSGSSTSGESGSDSE
ncbi:hypothetical protein G7Y79_00052g087760 [Physcia stellaris]|nr:hypothetical protein G7Y79_00052g087760 [Physcia stellaris]